VFPAWESDAVERIIVKDLDKVANYEPGLFYKRELPCILSLLEDIDQALEAIVIDGYVSLGKSKNPGLGMYLYESIGKSVPVIGVAKTEFVGTPGECRVFRGKSRSPLYVTTIGMPLSEAKTHIEEMHGKHRIPTLLKRVDEICRGVNV
jgi:deoxyribonuclease V